MEEAPHLAAAMGTPLFTTDLYLPTYRPVCLDRWKIVHVPFVLDRGYYSGISAISGMAALLRRTADEPPVWANWMSLSPKEIESQELACRYARGHTVVMGLGLGWVAVNTALRSTVQHVTVVERDPEVIALLDLSGALEGLAPEVREKLDIVQADALEWRPDDHVDFLHADIWRDLAEPQVLDDVRLMQANVRADTIYYWGQELTIYAEAKKLLGTDEGREVDGQLIERCVSESIGLPLLIPPDLDYAAMVRAVIQQRRERGVAVP